VATKVTPYWGPGSQELMRPSLVTLCEDIPTPEQEIELAGEAVARYLYEKVYVTPLVRPLSCWDRMVPVPPPPDVTL